MKSIVLIIPFFGKWPTWFNAHLLSIKENPTVDWIFYTDCEIPKEMPSNCTFIKSTISQMETLFSEKIGVPVYIDKSYKLCDLKPSYGHVFEDIINDYDFWGFTDVDIIWGDIRKEMTNEILENFDIISSRKGFISGHFNLLRNTEKINKLYRKNDWYKAPFSNREMKRFCEGTFTEITKEAIEGGIVSVKWDRILCNQERGRDSHQEYYLDRWLWKAGKMLELKHGKSIDEVMYLHFINWKRTMKYCEVEYADSPVQFYISYNGIHYNTHSRIGKASNGFKNLFNGYWVQQYIRIKKFRLKSLIKRISRKVKPTLKK